MVISVGSAILTGRKPEIRNPWEIILPSIGRLVISVCGCITGSTDLIHQRIPCMHAPMQKPAIMSRDTPPMSTAISSTNSMSVSSSE